MLTESVGNLEKPGLANRQEPREAGQEPTDEGHITETPLPGMISQLSLCLGVFPSEV